MDAQQRQRAVIDKIREAREHPDYFGSLVLLDDELEALLDRVDALTKERDLQKELGDSFAKALWEAERRVDALTRALEDQRRRWNRHSTRLTMAGVKASGRDMDDAVNAIDEALAERGGDE